MSQLQEDGWPLGLRPLNARVVGMLRNIEENHGSVSFTTSLLTSVTSTTSSSSDLDSQSTGSFFHDKSITLGRLIGVSSILELSRRSSNRERRRTTSSTTEILKDQENPKSNPWLFFFSLCSRPSTDVVVNNTPSLGHFLEAERRATRMKPTSYGSNEFSPIPILSPSSDLNPLFVGGQEANQPIAGGGAGRPNTELLQNGNGYGAPLVLSCLCGQLIE